VDRAIQGAADATALPGRLSHPRAERDVVLAAVEGRLHGARTFKRDVRRERDRLQKVYVAERKSWSKPQREANRAQVKALDRVLNDPRALANAPAVFRAAAHYKQVGGKIERELVKRGRAGSVAGAGGEGPAVRGGAHGRAARSEAAGAGAHGGEARAGARGRGGGEGRGRDGAQAGREGEGGARQARGRAVVAAREPHEGRRGDGDAAGAREARAGDRGADHGAAGAACGGGEVEAGSPRAGGV
jgi:hypothetical protein